MEKHKVGKYIGRASRRVSQEELTLDEAIKDAYERAMASKSEDERNTLGGPLTLRFKIVGVGIEGRNPISDIIVYLDDDN